MGRDQLVSVLSSISLHSCGRSNSNSHLRPSISSNSRSSSWSSCSTSPFTASCSSSPSLPKACTSRANSWNISWLQWSSTQRWARSTLPARMRVFTAKRWCCFMELVTSQSPGTAKAPEKTSMVERACWAQKALSWTRYLVKGKSCSLRAVPAILVSRSASLQELAPLRSLRGRWKQMLSIRSPVSESRQGAQPILLIDWQKQAFSTKLALFATRNYTRSANSAPSSWKRAMRGKWSWGRRGRQSSLNATLSSQILSFSSRSRAIAFILSSNLPNISSSSSKQATRNSDLALLQTFSWDLILSHSFFWECWFLLGSLASMARMPRKLKRKLIMLSSSFLLLASSSLSWLLSTLS